MENWAGAWQRTHRNRWAQAAAVLSVLLTLAVGAVRLGVWEEVSEFVGISSPATPQTAQQPSTPPDAPAAVRAVLVGAPAAVPPEPGMTPIPSTAPGSGAVLVPPPAGQVVSSVPVVVVIAAAGPTRLVSSLGQVTVDISAGAVRNDVTLTYQPVTPDQIPPLPPGFTVSDRVFDLSVTGGPANEKGDFRFDTPIVVTVRLIVRDVVLSGGASGNIVIQHFHADRWELLPTEVDFDNMVARAEVDGLSIFALTIKEPGPQPAAAVLPAPAPTVTPTAAPTAMPEPTATPVPPTPRPTSTPKPALTPTPTALPTGTPEPPTRTPTPTPVPPTPTLTSAPTPAGPLITALASAVTSGRPVTAEFSGAPGNDLDWIGLYLVTGSNEDPATFQYLEGATEGSMTLTAPAVGGVYEFRMFADWPAGGYVDIATSGAIEVIPAPTATPTLTPTPRPLPTGTPTAVPTPTPTGTGTGPLIKFGPVSGRLVHDPSSDTVKTFGGGLSLRNFMAEARFVNPYPRNLGEWDYGFFFSNNIVLVSSNGNWYHYELGTTASGWEMRASGDTDLDTSSLGGNLLRLIVVGGEGWLFVNGTARANLDVKPERTASDVEVATGFFSDTEVAGRATAFDDFTVTAVSRLYGPTSGDLVFEAGFLEEHSSQVNVQDLVTQARFFNPYPVSQGAWSYGILVRYTDVDDFHALFVRSDGRWYHYARSAATGSSVELASGSVSLNLQANGSNKVSVITIGHEAWLLVNEVFVGKLKLGVASGTGDVRAFAGFFLDDGIPGTKTSFQQFSVWSPGAGKAAGPTPTAAPVSDTGGGQIAPEEHRFAAIEFAGDTDDWTFFGLQGSAVTVFMDQVQGSDLDPRLKLIAPSGRIEADDDDSGVGINALISNWVLLEGGQYTIRADSPSSSRLGKYQIGFAFTIPPKTNKAVSYKAGRFESGTISGERITVVVGSNLDVYVTLNVNTFSEGQLKVEVLKDIAFEFDAVISSCGSFLRLDLGSHELRACDFTASALTDDTVRQYYIKVFWDGDIIHAPDDPLTREAVTTKAGPTPTPTAVPPTPTPAPLGLWTTKPPMPLASNSPSVGAINGLIYAVAGWNGSQRNDLAVYNPATGTWATKAPRPSVGCCRAHGVINGVLYEAGGVNCCVTFNSVFAYNPATNTWSTRASMPTKRQSAASGVIAGKLYVAGGVKLPDSGFIFDVLANLEAYDPVSNSWTTLAAMPTARSAAGAGVVNGILYVMGGAIDSSTIDSVSTVEAYDPATNTWSTKSPMPTPRHQVGVAVVGNILYAIGGHDVGGNHLTTVEAYDPVSDSWTTKAAMPTPRSYFGVTELNGTIYAMGGDDAVSVLNANEAFTP